jgi:hypothetical protein
MIQSDLQPCADPACGVHGHGADLDVHAVTGIEGASIECSFLEQESACE